MEYLIGSLLLLNVFQFIYWSRHTQTLIDKIMSRNYAEYVQVQSMALNSSPVNKAAFSEDNGNPKDDAVLSELNKSFGL